MLICDKELRDLWEIFATIPANPLFCRGRQTPARTTPAAVLRSAPTAERQEGRGELAEVVYRGRMRRTTIYIRELELPYHMGAGVPQLRPLAVHAASVAAASA